MTSFRLDSLVPWSQSAPGDKPASNSSMPPPPTLPEVKQPGPLSRTAMWLAGVNPDLVPAEERVEYTAGGIMVVATGGMAAVGMYFAVTTALGASGTIGRAVALMWGLVVATLDRWLLGTPKDPDASRAASIASAAARIVMALSLALVVSEFLVLRIYNSEVNAHLQAETAAAAADAEQTAAELVADRKKNIEAARQRADQAVVDAETKVTQAEAVLVDACAAAPGCMVDRPSTYPPAAARANHDAARNGRLLTQAQAHARTEHARLDTEAARLTAEAAAERERLVDAERGRTGLLAREEALSALTAANPGLEMRRWALTGFLIVLDLLPVLLKVLRRPTEYDVLALELAARRAEVDRARIRTAGNAALAKVVAAGESLEADATAARAWLSETPQSKVGTQSRTKSKLKSNSSQTAGRSRFDLSGVQGGRPKNSTDRAWEVYRDTLPPSSGWNSESLRKAAGVSQTTAYRMLREVLTKLRDSRSEDWTAEELAETGRVTVAFAHDFLGRAQ